jgi:hypothetical protein
MSHHRANPLIDLPDRKIRRYAKQMAASLVKAAESPERRTAKFFTTFKALRTPDSQVIDIPVRVVANLHSLPTKPLSVRRGLFSTNKDRTEGSIRLTVEGSLFDLDGSKFYPNAEKHLAAQIQQILRHEMTHALDPAWRYGAKAKYDERKARVATGKRREKMGYYDDPMEVRAITRKAVDEAIKSARRWKRTLPDMRVVPEVILAPILKLPEVARMRPANQNKLVKQATRVLEEEGLLDQPVGPSLRIDDRAALLTLGRIEGAKWLSRQQADKDKLRLPNGFYLNRSAWQILKNMGSEAEGLTVADLDAEAGLIAGNDGTGYIVEPGGEIFLVGETADRKKIAKALQVMQVIE